MSGLACLLDRRGGRAGPRRIEKIGEALQDYGEVSSTLCSGPIAVVVRHPADPRARERHGPIRDESSGLVVAVAGRFGLAGDAHASGAGSIGNPDQLGCARWALRRWSADGAGWLDEIAGSFTLVVADPASGWMSVFRDHLGDLKVYHRLTDRLAIVATEAVAITRDESVVAEPDRHSAARFLGFRFGHSDRSFFRDVRELAPAHRLDVSAGSAACESYWRFRARRTNPAPDELGELFRSRLQRSMDFHTTGLAHDEIGLSLSGGLDSTALAALAPRGVRAYSWFFEETPDPEERENTEEVSRYLDLPVRWVPGDGCWPLSGGLGSTFVHPSSPYLNPFAVLKSKLYSAARGDGCRRMIVGDAGDALYEGSDLWLRDALFRLRPWALASLAGAVARAFTGDPGSRAALRHLVPIRRGGRILRNSSRPPWMTAGGASLLPREELSPILPEGSMGSRYDLSVGARNIELESEERRLFHQCGIERANPFWYRPLLETVLQWPAYRLHRDGRDKVLTRQSLRRLLPDRVLDSGRVGILGSFFLRGIDENRRVLSDLVFRRPQSDWQRYVEREWLEPHLTATDTIGFGHTILWRTISYELWVRRVWGSEKG